tara:strand:- start:4 stop:606 length:603 start_codon:yes stop_codon:yes gene_type:complete
MSDLLLLAGATYFILKGGDSSSSSSSGGSGSSPPDSGSGNTPDGRTRERWIAAGVRTSCGFQAYRYEINFQGHGTEITYVVADTSTGNPSDGGELCVADSPSPYKTAQTPDGRPFSMFKTQKDAQDYADYKCDQEKDDGGVLEDIGDWFGGFRRKSTAAEDPAPAKAEMKETIVRRDLDSTPQFEVQSYEIGDIYSGRSY